MMRSTLNTVAIAGLLGVALSSVLILMFYGITLASEAPGLEVTYIIPKDVVSGRVTGIGSGREGNIYISVTQGGERPEFGQSTPKLSYISCYDRQGKELWKTNTGGEFESEINAIAVTDREDVLAVGSIGGNLGQGMGDSRCFLTAVNPSGKITWMKFLEVPINARANAISSGENGSTYVLGTTNGEKARSKSTAPSDVFLMKYDGTGNRLWSRHFGTSEDDIATALSADKYDNVYLGGYTQGGFTGQTNLGGTDAFICKYDGSGKEIWTRQFGTGAGDFLQALGLDNDNNLFSGGYTRGVLPGQKSSRAFDAFVRKYDPDGKELFTRQFGTYEDDIIYAMASTGNNIYVAGSTYDVFPGQQVFGFRDAFVRKYDTSGGELWTSQFGSDINDEAFTLAVVSEDNLVVGGSSLGALPSQRERGNEFVLAVRIAPPSVNSSITPAVKAQPMPPSAVAGSLVSVTEVKVEPVEVTPGNPATVTVTLVNSGIQPVDYLLALNVNQTASESRKVTLPAGLERSVKFEIIRFEPGNYSVGAGDKNATFKVANHVTSEITLLGMLLGMAAVLLTATAAFLLLREIKPKKKNQR